MEGWEPWLLGPMFRHLAQDTRLIINLNTKIEFLTRHARDAYDVLLYFIFTPITAVSGSQRSLGARWGYWTVFWTGGVIDLVRALVTKIGAFQGRRWDFE